MKPSLGGFGLEERFDQLSETQKRLLREVTKGRTSKEMSMDVGLEPGSIDVYISEALGILGVANRRAAALALAEHEASILSRSKFRSEGIAKPANLAQRGGRRRVIAFLERINFPPVGGREHEYNFSDRMIASFKIAGSGFLVIIVLSMAITVLFWAFPKN